MTVAEPWQSAEIAGPQKALVIMKPDVVVAIVKKAKRPIIVAGHLVVTGESVSKEPVEFLIAVAKAGKIPVIATLSAVKAFTQRGFSPVAWMPAVDIGNRLQDTSWRGIDGKGAYDLLLILGLPYYLEWLLLSGLKHFAQGLKLISLDRYYQPHAAWSFPNISLETWEENLNLITEKLRGPA
jgi:acetyl-CoA decarbonylase/synthase complex subunit epsilon